MLRIGARGEVEAARGAEESLRLPPRLISRVSLKAGQKVHRTHSDTQLRPKNVQNYFCKLSETLLRYQNCMIHCFSRLQHIKMEWFAEAGFASGPATIRRGDQNLEKHGERVSDQNTPRYTKNAPKLVLSTVAQPKLVQPNLKGCCPY